MPKPKLCGWPQRVQEESVDEHVPEICMQRHRRDEAPQLASPDQLVVLRTTDIVTLLCTSACLCKPSLMKRDRK